MVDIPTEIWLHIASFLSNQQLRGLYSVNRVFFEESMNARWREVILKTRNVGDRTRMFERLSDPFIAGRVRSFALQYSRGPRESSLRHADPLAFRNGIMDSLKLLKSALHSPRNLVPELIRKVMAITPHLVNVSHLDINSAELPPKYDLRPLCNAFWGAFGTHLRCLTLGGNIESFRAIMETYPVLPALSELRLEFTDNIFRLREVDSPLPAGDSIIMELLVSFVNGLSPHLEGLRIWSWATELDISSFFSGLTIFPKLQYFGLRMFFDNTARDASGLRNILGNHSTTLNSIDLRLNSSRLQLNTEQEEPLARFLLQCLADEKCFSQARSLDFYPTISSQGTEIVLTTLKRVSITLTRLTIRDRYLGDEEALSIIDAASECVHLKYLRLNVFKFSIGIMDRLAERLPNLETLWISVGILVPQNDVTTLGHEFTEELKTRFYDKWRLKDLSIWQGGAEVDMDAMRMLGASIPSLESFFEGQTYL